MTLSHEATETRGCLSRWHGRVLHTSLSGTCRADPPWGGRALVPDSVSLPRGTHSRPRGRGAVPMSRPWALGGGRGGGVAGRSRGRGLQTQAHLGAPDSPWCSWRVKASVGRVLPGGFEDPRDQGV